MGLIAIPCGRLLSGTLAVTAWPRAGGVISTATATRNAQNAARSATRPVFCRCEPGVVRNRSCAIEPATGVTVRAKIAIIRASDTGFPQKPIQYPSTYEQPKAQGKGPRRTHDAIARFSFLLMG